MNNLEKLVEEMTPVLVALGLDPTDETDVFGMADAFAWFPMWDGGNGDKYDLTLFRLKCWGEKIIDNFAERYDVDEPDQRPLGSKCDPNGPDVQPIPRALER
jgi:hypothetical protein